MSWVSLLFTVLLIGLSVALEDVNSANEVLAEDEEVEGRRCTGSCNGGSVTDTHLVTSVVENPEFSAFIPTGSFDASGLLGGAFGAVKDKGYGILAIPILAVNIAILVLLAILLAHVKHFGGYGDTGTGEDVYHYAPVPAYVGGGGGHSSYQSYDASASGYSKRSSTDGRNFQSPSTFQFLSQIVADAIDKYSKVDQGEE